MGMFQYINQPTILGYPHDYGKPSYSHYQTPYSYYLPSYSHWWTVIFPLLFTIIFPLLFHLFGDDYYPMIFSEILIHKKKLCHLHRSDPKLPAPWDRPLRWRWDSTCPERCWPRFKHPCGWWVLYVLSCLTGILLFFWNINLDILG